MDKLLILTKTFKINNLTGIAEWPMHATVQFEFFLFSFGGHSFVFGFWFFGLLVFVFPF